MELQRVRALRGPNLWSRHTAIEAIIFCEEEERSIQGLIDFEIQLRTLFPQLHFTNTGPSRNSISMAHVIEYVVLGLQAQAGCPVTFSRTVKANQDGIYQVVVEYSEESVGRMALDLAWKLVIAARENQDFNLQNALDDLSRLDEDVRLGPSTGSIVQSAVERNIPYRRLTDGSLVQFGWGSKQKRIQAAETSLTSAIAESIAQDKELTKDLLHAAGVAVPLGKVVDNADDAWKVAQELGSTIVIKPRDGNQGKGVAVNIKSEEQVRAAFAVAQHYGRKIIVERYMPGHDFRLLVVGDQLIAAARRDPPQVIGDGVLTITELVAEINKDPLRGDGHATPLTKIRLDDIAIATLAKQKLDVHAIPRNGQRVVLRNNANLSTGGSATDVTEDVHPDLAASAITAAKMVGLDICGVDIVCEAIYKPLEEQGGGVVEVNAAPGLRMHLNPSYGKSQPVGEAIISLLYPRPENGRIPVVAVSGTNGKTTTVRLIAHLLRAQGNRVGMTTTDGIYVENERIDSGDCSGPKSARNVLMHPEVDAAVFETARGGILREGLGYDACDVAVITNIGEGDHLGMSYIETVEELAEVKSVIVRNVAPTGHAVLNAADPMVVKMAKSCRGQIIFFGLNAHNPVISTHRARGKKAVFRDKEYLIAAIGNRIVRRISLANIPLTEGGQIGFQIENTLASIAAAWALDIDWQTIEKGLGSFVSDVITAPGRFNLFKHNGATVIADYGHNPDAIRALVQATNSIPAQRRHVVISGAGDRRDDDIRRQTQILGEAFDSVILYQDQCQRGREDGEVITLLREGLEGATKTKHIEEIRGEFLAIDTALEQLNPNDLCLILIDQVEESLEYLQKVTKP
ncbi:phosphoribosylglycinamide formyltransferase 2 [Polynucleobacter sp. SHI8]|uniref:cyanophycin synthetase n=1 Tax=unclassified Polynucleobacter TaxID=2640945 RepID=UPI0024923471|nr:MULTISPECIES: cyanophycin synthetase [unclassified Polynucleobacter]BDW10521.1 phosphoribosylglycinamide formyltransferase 2 [Polynucleobacter sp. SHI2]BDW12967.1 phosphoribosylglycinamide formyltransferase 2 [Polynucleobacter sp. SHI8]